jgi:hypothetical protein
VVAQLGDAGATWEVGVCKAEIAEDNDEAQASHFSAHSSSYSTSTSTSSSTSSSSSSFFKNKKNQISN